MREKKIMGSSIENILRMKIFRDDKMSKNQRRIFFNKSY